MRHLNMVYISSSFLIGLLFQGVSSYFGLIGGTVGVMMASGIPLACFYKLITINSKDMMIMAFMIILSILCFLGAMQSIFNPLWYIWMLKLKKSSYFLGNCLTLKHTLFYEQLENWWKDVIGYDSDC